MPRAKKSIIDWTNAARPQSNLKKKRNKKAQRRLEEDYDFDPYCVNVNNSNNSYLYFAHDDQYNEVMADVPMMNRWRDKVSREEKKLQYYLDMIERQERAETRRKSRKQNKETKSPKNISKPTKAEEESSLMPEPDLPLKISIAKGSDPELEFLAKSLRKSAKGWGYDSVPYELEASDIHHIMKLNKDELYSWSQSEDQNESTLDRLRTPTQNICRTSSICPTQEEFNGFENFRISSIYDKTSLDASEQGEEEQQHKAKDKCLKESFWERLIRLTRMKQARLNSVCEAIQTSPTVSHPANIGPQLELESKPKPRPSILKLKSMRNYKSLEVNTLSLLNDDDSNNFPKPVFVITRKRKCIREETNKDLSSSSSIGDSSCTTANACTTPPPRQPTKHNEAITLVS